MKKINLSRKSKLFIGGIGSLAVLATIPAAVVACSSTTDNNSQSTTKAEIADAMSNIASAYTLQAKNALVTAKYDFSLITSQNIATVVNMAGILPKLSNGLSYIFTPSTTPATAGAASFTFDVSISAGAYTNVQSPAAKTITVTLPASITPVGNATSATLKTWLASAYPNETATIAVNSLGAALPAAIFANGSTTASLNPAITDSTVLNYISGLPFANFTNINTTVVASSITLESNNTSVQFKLQYSGTGFTETPTETITLTGFMNLTPTQSEINQAQESFNTYISSFANLTILKSVNTTPQDFVNSDIAKPASPNVAITYADLNATLSTAAAPLSIAIFPANMSAANLVITVSSNTTVGSSYFVVTMQFKGATTPGIAISVIANAVNISTKSTTGSSTTPTTDTGSNKTTSTTGTGSTSK